MAKPIKLTEELIAQMANEFAEKLRNVRMSDGKVSYDKSFTYKNSGNGVSVLFTPLAYAKMTDLVAHFSSEVGWHGTVQRLDAETFLITDIIVYPQVVTGATVNTDQEEYTKWLIGLDDDTANSLHMHGHSHVNFGTSPSGVDDTHREQLLAQVDKEGYYIFIIWNKRAEHTCVVYDLKNNTLYEDSDVEVGIYDENYDPFEFLKIADDLVKTKTYVTTAASAVGAKATTSVGTAYSKSTGKGSKKGSKRSVVEQYPGYFGYGGVGIEDYDEYVFGTGRTY